jgi:hypothetical protein
MNPLDTKRAIQAGLATFAQGRKLNPDFALLAEWQPVVHGCESTADPFMAATRFNVSA